MKNVLVNGSLGGLVTPRDGMLSNFHLFGDQFRFNSPHSIPFGNLCSIFAPTIAPKCSEHELLGRQVTTNPLSLGF